MVKAYWEMGCGSPLSQVADSNRKLKQHSIRVPVGAGKGITQSAPTAKARERGCPAYTDIRRALKSPTSYAHPGCHPLRSFSK